MKIEIWSDIMCPFCYMGKKQLDLALSRLSYGKDVEIIWRSFELNPEIKHIPGKSVSEYLSEIKNMPIDDVERMQDRIAEQGSALGIQFNFAKTPVCNSHNAHKLIHAAQKQGKAHLLKEALFKKYFTEGTNVESIEILLELADDLQIDLSPWKGDPFNSETLEEEVEHDIYNAQQVGARGVPFFIFNEAYSLSGAHGAETIYKVLETARIKADKQNQ